jgi:hypothetical protein
MNRVQVLHFTNILFPPEPIYYIHARIFRILSRFCAVQFLGFSPLSTFFL